MEFDPSPDAAEPRFGRALLALTAAATIAVSPTSGHAVAVFAVSKSTHDVGHNDWAFQGTTADGVVWAATYNV